MAYRSAKVVLIVACVLFVGCDDKKGRLERGMQYARITLEAAGKNPMAAISFGSILESGGTPVAYLYAGLPDKNPVFDSYEWQTPTRPWTIVIKEGSTPRNFILEGYGENLKKPILVENVTIQEFRPPE